ncbi:MAG: hypothetical protein DRQ44_10445 [Gammaproteobacteria bacterium]|nr:MAG: hypothetical protein DRQ44_10445 [Gammaproteobacteria bacterium]
MIKRQQIFLCTILSTFGHVASADHPTVAFGAEGAGPVSTIPAIPMPAGSWGFGVRAEIINNDAFSTQQLEDFAADGLEGVHSIDKITSTSLSLSYGVTDDLSVNARLPYIERKNIRESEIEDGVPEAHTHGDSSGVGDLLILAQYQVSNSEKTDVAIQFGIKTPTGETEVKDKDGVRFETEFQPGSGSWDYLLGTSISKNINAFCYHANILYNKTTEGSQSTEIGYALSYNAALSYRLGFDENHDHASHDHNDLEVTGVEWDLLIELNGETRAKNEISGIEDENSGGSILFLSPGVRVSAGKFGGFISVGMPIIENQNGKQTDIDTRIVAGLSLAI